LPVSPVPAPFRPFSRPSAYRYGGGLNFPHGSAILSNMKIQINPRGNGACPLCRFHEKCLIQDSIEKHTAGTYREGELALVIYSCPKFEENTKE